MNKEEAIEILSEMRSEYNLFGDEEEATRYHVLSWAIKEMNTAPVKHGKWEVKGQDLYCSVCGMESAYTWHGSSKFSNYCPTCGAKMDGGKDDV